MVAIQTAHETPSLREDPVIVVGNQPLLPAIKPHPLPAPHPTPINPHLQPIPAPLPPPLPALPLRTLNLPNQEAMRASLLQTVKKEPKTLAPLRTGPQKIGTERTQPVD